MHAFLDALPIIIGGTTVAILAGLADIARRQRRQVQAQNQWHADISQAVLGEPARQGVDKVPSLREQFAAINRKVESLSNRPAMNGGFQELMEAAVAAARQTDQRVEAMHLSNIARFDILDQAVANVKLTQETGLAVLAEEYHINLPQQQPTGELHGELHLTLHPETPSD
jgi:hypothetical protein